MQEKILTVLRDDHQRIQEACSQLSQAEGLEDRKELVNRLHQVILPHLIAEEEAFYPAWLGKEGVEESFRVLDQHREVRMALDQLLETAAESPGYSAKAAQLCDLIALHLREEEEVVFKHFPRVAGDRDASLVLARFRGEKERIRREIAREVIIPAPD